MTGESSSYIILLSLIFICCDVHVATSFSTTTHSFFINTKYYSTWNSQNADTTSTSSRNNNNNNNSINSVQPDIYSQFHPSKRSIARAPIRIQSRSCLFALSSDVDESESNPRANYNDDSDDHDMEYDFSAARDEIVAFGEDGLGTFDPAKKLPLKREVIVGDPQQKVRKPEKSATDILTELAAIQKQGPQKYCILGSRHLSYLHQQIIELLSYALVLSENHVYTSGAMGTNAAAIRGALRAGRPDLLTVILPQSLHKQTLESQELLRGVTDLIVMPKNDELSLDVASRLCNSKLLSETDQLVAFAFHESTTVIEATREAKKLEMLVTTLFLD